MAKERVWLWDNVKALLIVLVVLGHFITQFTGKSDLYRSLFLIVYSFHMPLFVFVSGLFCKSSFKDDRLNFNRVLAFVILFYLLKAAIYAVHHPEKFRPFYEAGTPWYMFAMAFWLCMTFVLRKANPKVVIPCLIALALGAGYIKDINSTFCMSRIITLYPFFFLGYSLDPVALAEKISFQNDENGRKKRMILKSCAAAVFLLAVVLSFALQKQLYLARPVLVACHPYSKLKDPSMGIVIRALWYPVAALLSASVICLMPSLKNRLSYIGASTMPIFFFHRPILYIIMNVGLGGKLFGISPVLFLLCSFVLTFILSYPKLNIPFNKLMKLNVIKQNKGEKQ